MIHALATLALAFLDWRLGFLAAAYFLGREIACAEYRWIAAYGGGKRANMPLWGGLDYRVWNWKSLLDWLLPAGVAGAFALL